MLKTTLLAGVYCDVKTAIHVYQTPPLYAGVDLFHSCVGLQSMFSRLAELLTGRDTEKISLSRLVVTVCLLGYLILFVSGLAHYQGSKFIYSVFSATFLVVLALGFYKQDSYGYMFITLFLWLGFWLKFTVHTIYGMPYVQEPIGAFIPSSGNLDNILMIAISAGAGVILARFAYSLMPISKSGSSVSNCPFPRWYLRFRPWLWMGLWAIIVLVPAANIFWGIAQTGFAPRTILPWPLNAVISWFLANGLFMCALILMSWDFCSGRRNIWGFYAIIAESLFSSVSLLSRATFVLHAMPVVAILLKNGREFYVAFWRRKLAIVACVWLVFFVFSFTMVNTLRLHFFPRATSEINQEIGFFTKMILFSIDRWIGVEGVMAVYSCPEKGTALFIKAVAEKKTLSKPDLYQSICRYPYQGVDFSRYKFGSVPGVVAFFYYSGSLLIVFLGLFLLTIMVKLGEKLVYNFTNNTFLCSFYGIIFANIVSQFGMAPRQIFWSVILVTALIAFIWLIQRDNICSSPKQES